MNTYITDLKLSDSEIRTIRKTMNMTQKDFAVLLGVSVKSVERWESGNCEITGSAATILQMLFMDPSLEDRLSVPEKKLPLRLWYMYYNMPCTLIDADEKNRIVRIKNYTNRIFYRAFGVVTEPSYEDFEEFLESRCFPRTRDKQKIILEAMGLMFYDPLSIIEKTEGRMAEDHFRLIIDR